MGQTKVDKLVATELREGTRSVPSGTQAAHIADAGDTTGNPTALTASAPAALTSAQIAGGEPPTEAEFNALQADVAALRTTLAAVVADNVAMRAFIVTLETDGDLYTDRINKLIDVTEAFQQTATS